MAKIRSSHARLALVLMLAAMGLACAPTAMPLPMLAAGHGRARPHQATHGGEATPASAHAR